MQLIQTIKFAVKGHHYDLNIYRNKSKDSLVIVPEDTTGKKDVKYLKAFVHMRGEFELPPEKYDGYKKALDAVKDELKGVSDSK